MDNYKFCADCKYFSTYIEESPCKECWEGHLDENSEHFLDKPYFEQKEDDE